MTDDRRTMIQKALDLLTNAAALLEEAREGEQDAFDSLPEENRDDTDASTLEEMASKLDDAVTSVESAFEGAEEAMNSDVDDDYYYEAPDCPRGEGVMVEPVSPLIKKGLRDFRSRWLEEPRNDD